MTGNKTKIKIDAIRTPNLIEGNALVVTGDGGVTASGITGIGSGIAGIEVQNTDVSVATDVTVLNFEGTALYGITDDGSGKVTITVNSGGGTASGGGVDVEQGGTPKVTGATTLNFVSGALITDAGGGQANITISGGGGGGIPDFTVWFPDAPPASGYSSGGVDDDEFDDASFDTGIWSIYDVASRQTETEAEYGLNLSQSGTDYFQGIYQPVPAGTDWSFTTFVGHNWYQTGNGVAGILLLENISSLSTSDVFVWGMYRGGSGFGWRWAKAPQYNGYTGDDSWINDSKDIGWYLRIRVSGSTWYFDWSLDGYTWIAYAYTQTEEFTAQGVGIGYRLDNTGWSINCKFARFTDDSSHDQMLYGDRVGMWRT